MSEPETLEYVVKIFGKDNSRFARPIHLTTLYCDSSFEAHNCAHKEIASYTFNNLPYSYSIILDDQVVGFQGFQKGYRYEQ